MVKYPIVLVAAMVFASFTQAESRATVIPVSEVKWEKLNPARGDKSPRAGTLWGDRAGTGPSGFLVQFVDGFSSPPHIHNATYRAVVISGLIHNDDPDAASMWMPPGSFWTQPKGEVHITAASGVTNIALVEIDLGPYLVLPVEEAFDSGERPVNVDVSNIVWVGEQGGAPAPGRPEFAYLWGKLEEGHSNGTFLKLPPGFTGSITSDGTYFHAVLVSGELTYLGTEPRNLDPGSYFGSTGQFVHPLEVEEGEVVVYVRTNAGYLVNPGS